jgi:hypothetical protein
MKELTPEERKAQDRESAKYSIDMLKAGKPQWMSDEDWADAQNRNKSHLQIMLSRGVLTPADVAGVL